MSYRNSEIYRGTPRTRLSSVGGRGDGGTRRPGAAPSPPRPSTSRTMSAALEWDEPAISSAVNGDQAQRARTASNTPMNSIMLGPRESTTTEEVKLTAGVGSVASALQVSSATPQATPQNRPPPPDNRPSSASISFSPQSGLTCPQGHSLKAYEAPNGSFVCAGCKRRIRAKDTFSACKVCNFIACLSCGQSAAVRASVQAKPPELPPRASPNKIISEMPFAVLLHSYLRKRGKHKWNQRYCVLIRPTEDLSLLSSMSSSMGSIRTKGSGLSGSRGSSVSGGGSVAAANDRSIHELNRGGLFYYKYAKTGWVADKKAVSGGSGSESGSKIVDVTRLFEMAGKDGTSTKQSDPPKLLVLAGARIEPNGERWGPPSGTFGFVLVDGEGVEYPFSAESEHKRQQWIAALDSVINPQDVAIDSQSQTSNVLQGHMMSPTDGPKSNTQNDLQESGRLGSPPKYYKSGSAPIRAVSESTHESLPPGALDDSRFADGQQRIAAFQQKLTARRLASADALESGGDTRKRSILIPIYSEDDAKNKSSIKAMTIELPALLSLLSDPYFLRNDRHGLLSAMRDVLTICGTPAQVPVLLSHSFRRFRNSGNSAGGGGKGAEHFEAEELAPLLDRLIDLLGLEPVNSAITSRVVGCSIALLSAFAKGHPRMHAMLSGCCASSRMRLAALGFEIGNLVARTEHPGILEGCARLLGAILAPALSPVYYYSPCNSDDLSAMYGVAEKIVTGKNDDNIPNSKSVSFGKSSYQAWAEAGADNSGIVAPKVNISKSGGIRLHLSDDDDQKEAQRTTTPLSLGSAEIEHGVLLRCHQFAILRSDRCPLWGPLFSLIAVPAHMPRLCALSILADLSSDPEVAVSICSAHQHSLPHNRQAAYEMMLISNQLAIQAHNGNTGAIIGGNIVPPESPKFVTETTVLLAQQKDTDLKTENSSNKSRSGLKKELGSQRSLIVDQTIHLLQGDNDIAIVQACLTFILNLLTHAQTEVGYDPIFRAICTPDILLFSTDIFTALHAKSRRRFERGLALRTARAHFGHESKMIETLNSEDNAEREEKKDDLFQRLEEIADEELLDKTLTPIEIAVELEIAEKTALCLWHIGCLLTHSGSKGGDETRGKIITPLDNFDMFSEKLLQL